VLPEPADRAAKTLGNADLPVSTPRRIIAAEPHLRERTMAAYKRISVTRLAGALGAEVGGVDIGTHLDDPGDRRDPARPA
jgi:hypothetical protein